MLHAHLLHSVHLVRFAPPVIELRPQPEAPRDLASRLAALLSEATGTRWTIAVSAATANRRSPNKATPPTPRAGRPRLITRWCARSWKRFLARASTRCMIRRRMPMACRRQITPEHDRISRRPSRVFRRRADGDRPMKNLAGLMKQAQQMQSKMQEMQSKLEAMEMTGRPAPAWSR